LFDQALLAEGALPVDLIGIRHPGLDPGSMPLKKAPPDLVLAGLFCL